MLRIFTSILLSIILFLALAILPEATLAEGTFSCGLITGGGCVVRSPTQCGADSTPDPNKCAAFNDSFDCNGKTFACTSNDEPNLPPPDEPPDEPPGGVTRFNCTSSGCQPTTGTGQFTDAGSCQASCNTDANNPDFDRGEDQSGEVLCGDDGVNTALGCLSFTSAGFINTLLPLAIGFGGACALILMLYGFFILSTSAGIPDKVKAGQEIISSAIAGLLFIIFAVVLMSLIGLQIFKLPGL